ncbi:hypothetical protein ACI65C_010407 [Semiaphis heraclei]
MAAFVMYHGALVISLRVIDTESSTAKNRKRELSISESENEYNDHTDTYNCETYTKRPLCMDSQLNAMCKRDGVNCNYELTYQPPNKIIKYDIEMISDDSCDSDEKNIRSTENTLRHVNKRIKIDKNLIFHTDVDYSERDSKSLTNKEVEMLLELSYNFDDEDNNAHVKTNEEKCNRFVCKDNVIFFESDCNFENEFISNSDKLVLSQNNEEDRNDFNEVLDKKKLTDLNCRESAISITDEKLCINSKLVSIPDQADKYNMSKKHVFDNSKIGFSNEPQRILNLNSESLSNDYSEKNANQSEWLDSNAIKVNDDEVLLAQAYENNGGNSVLLNNQMVNSIVELCNSENETVSINKLNKSICYEEETVEEIIKQTIEDIMVSLDSLSSFSLGIINVSTSISNFENTLKPVDDIISDSLTAQEKICFVSKNFNINPHESPNIESETFEYNNNIYTSDIRISDQKLIETKRDNEKMPSDYDKTTMLQIVDNNAQKNESVSISDQVDTLNTSNKHVFDETILDNMNIGVPTEVQSMSQSNDFSESSLNHSAEFVNIDEILEARVNGYNADNSCPESIDQDDLLDLTECENDHILLDHENSTSIIKEGINCTMDYGKMIIQEGKLYESTEHLDDQEHVCEFETEEEMLKNLINHENNELEIVTDFTNNGLLEVTRHISSENASLISEGTRNSQSLVDGDQFISSNMFYFGTENCRDVSVHAIDSLDDHEMNNYSKNNTTVHSMENNDSLDSLNTEIEKSVVELCNSENKTIFGMKKKSNNYEEETVKGNIVQTIENNKVSLNSSNSFHHGLINVSKSVNNLENILESADESSVHSESLATQDKMDFGSDSNTNPPLHEFQRTVSETYEYNNNNNIYTSGKRNSDKKLIESKRDNEKTPSDYDKTTMLQIVDNNAHKISESVNISEQVDTLNTSNKHVFDETILDNMNIGVHTEVQSMSQSDGCSENSLNQSAEFVNVDEILEARVDEYNADNSCPESIDQDGFLDLTKCENDQILSNHENSTSIIKEGINCTKDYEKMIGQERKSNESTEHIDDQEHACEIEEKILKKLINNENDKLEIVTDFTNNSLLEVTRHISSENSSLITEGNRSGPAENLNTSVNSENDDTVFNNNVIDILTERSLSLNSSDARQILESSNDGPEDLDDSLLFKPSDRDLVRYGIECEEYEKSISRSLNNFENNVSNEEIILQCKSPCFKLNEIKSTNNLKSSSCAKDYEDNVIDFYDCDLSSIENSDVEDNLLSSFEKDTSIDNCIFYENQDKLKNVTNPIRNEQTSDNNLKIQNISSSESCDNSTSVVEPSVSLIHSSSHDHQYNKIMSTSMSMKLVQMNPDTDDKLETLNHSSVKIIPSNAIPSFNDSDNVNILQANNFCIDQDKLKSNFNEDPDLEDSNETHNQNNTNELISEYNTHQNLKVSQKSYTDKESEGSKVSSMKLNGNSSNSTISKLNNEEMAKTNTVQSTSFDISHSEMEKKNYLDEIIKNKQFNEIDEKLDVNESIISPYISQSLAKSTNLKSALSKKAASNINIHDMGDKALTTYLTQQTMTLDVLEVLHKSLDTCPSSGVSMEDPEGLVVTLMPHQKHAIAWLIWRESQEPHGGILADDMGLGKTLSMISLILKLKEKPHNSLLPVVSNDNRRNDVIIGGTLVICPASLINQWETEVKTKLKPGLLKVGQYYGVNRNFSALELAENDLVITSYHVVMWDHKIRQNSSPLYKIKWNRVILDEGHNIRNHKTQTSVAVCNIKSLNRWAITGTPIHNKEADFFTLLKFVRCKPFDDWPVWKRWVGNNDDAGKHRLSLLVKTLINLFATYLYDRAAKEKVFDPSIEVQSKVQYFQEQSQDKDKVFQDHPELLKLFRKFKNIEEIQTYHILVLLLRLQQMCCHPILIKGPITEECIKQEDKLESIPEHDIDVTSNDSYDENTDTNISPNNIDLSELMSCLTLEDEPVKKKSVIDIFKKSWMSSKIEKICNLVNQKVLINGNRDKAIIVSQWPSFLYLIHKHLTPYNAKMEMFSGTIPISKRNKIIQEFNNPNDGPQILLLSLKAGGVGLNLMSANHMFLIDVHWNPQLEAQACDRIYRVGQTKPVYLYKFICANTIETRIVNIQCNKLKIAENLFKGTSSVSSKLTIDDLKQIFQFH